MRPWNRITRRLAPIGLGLILVWTIPGCKPKGPEIMTTKEAIPFKTLMAGNETPCFPSLELKGFSNRFSFEELVAEDGPASIDLFFSENAPEFPEDEGSFIPEADHRWIEQQFSELKGKSFMAETGFLPENLCRFPWKGYIDDNHLNAPLSLLMQLREPFLGVPYGESEDGLSQQIQKANRAAINKDYFEAEVNHYGHFAPAKARNTYHFESWNLYRFDPEFQWLLYHNRFVLQYSNDLNLERALIYRSLADKKTNHEVGSMEQLFYLRMNYEEGAASPSKLTIRTIQLLPLEVKGEPWRFFASEDVVTLGE